MTSFIRFSARQSALSCALVAASLLGGCADTDVEDADDAELGRSTSSATEERYYDNEDGTISDANTWVLWQQDVGPEALSFEHASNYCAWLPLRGQGWRLPTLGELKAVVDSRFDPTIDTGSFPNTPAEQFWSSSPLAGSSSFVWNVDFATGKVRADTKGSLFRVRCVRGAVRTPD